MTDTPQVLLGHHLKVLKLPTFLREYDTLARQCATDAVDHVRYLLRLAELELIERERRTVERRINEARFPSVKSLDSFDFLALPSLNKALVLELARSEYVAQRENVIALGNAGTGKGHVALGFGLAACQKGLSVGFTTAAGVVHELIEARDEKRLLRLQRQLAGYKLLIIDELGYVPLSQTGAELLFEVVSQRYERGSTIVPFDAWTGVFASERLTGALLDRLTHHVHILEMNGDSYRLKQSRRRQRGARPTDASDPNLRVIRTSRVVTMGNASLNAMHRDRHEADAYRRIELITGTVRRRRWTIEEKAALVAESTRCGANVADVARRFGVNRGLLRTWRRKAMGEAPVFVPLRVEGLVAAADNDKGRADTPRSVGSDADTSTRPGTLEIESGGVRVRFSGPVDATALRLIILHIGRPA